MDDVSQPGCERDGIERDGDASKRSDCICGRADTVRDEEQHGTCRTGWFVCLFVFCRPADLETKTKTETPTRRNIEDWKTKHIKHRRQDQDLGGWLHLSCHQI